MSDAYTRWVILRVVGGQLVSLMPTARYDAVFVAPTVENALRVLGRGDLVAMPVSNGQMDALLTALKRADVQV
jgi:hypothetical protein